jgi:hypothetical protein
MHDGLVRVEGRPPRFAAASRDEQRRAAVDRPGWARILTSKAEAILVVIGGGLAVFGVSSKQQKGGSGNRRCSWLK